MEVMVRGQGDDITNFLPIHLEQIQSGAAKCKEEAKLVLNSFEEVSSILDDLTNAIILKKGKSEGNAKKALEEIENLERKKKEIKEDEERLKDEHEKTYREFQRRSNQLDKELDYQGSWSQVAKEGVKSLLSAPVALLKTAPTALVGAVTSAFKSQTPQVTF
jgi:chromosome segregation ATPase